MQEATHEDLSPHLALVDAPPHPRCRDTQTSKHPSAYFPQTSNFVSRCIGTTSVSAQPSQADIEESHGRSTSRLKICQWSREMPLYASTDYPLFPSNMPANFKKSSSNECLPAVWKSPVFSILHVSSQTFPTLALI